AVGGQHVHFVDQVDLEASATWRVLHVLQKLARVFHLGARCRVHFDQIEKTPFADFSACGALTTRRGGDASFAVEATRENARDRGFADTSGASEEIGVMKTAGIERIDQCLEHMTLSHQLTEIAGTPL